MGPERERKSLDSGNFTKGKMATTLSRPRPQDYPLKSINDVIRSEICDTDDMNAKRKKMYHGIGQTLAPFDYVFSTSSSASHHPPVGAESNQLKAFINLMGLTCVCMIWMGIRNA